MVYYNIVFSRDSLHLITGPPHIDFVLNSGNISIVNSSLALYLTEDNGGTRISSTRYVHYGKMTARSKQELNSVKTGRWAGVVAAFITMSDMKDEIDWECE
jgi:hypothetical protein